MYENLCLHLNKEWKGKQKGMEVNQKGIQLATLTEGMGKGNRKMGEKEGRRRIKDTCRIAPWVRGARSNFLSRSTKVLSVPCGPMSNEDDVQVASAMKVADHRVVVACEQHLNKISEKCCVGTPLTFTLETSTSQWRRWATESYISVLNRYLHGIRPFQSKNNIKSTQKGTVPKASSQWLAWHQNCCQVTEAFWQFTLGL